jgi:hypothetical protein
LSTISSLPHIESELNILAICFLIPVLLVFTLNFMGPKDLIVPGMENRLRNLCLERENKLHELEKQLGEKMEELISDRVPYPNQARSVLARQTAHLRARTPELLLLMVADPQGALLVSDSRRDLTTEQVSRLQSLAAEKITALAGSNLGTRWFGGVSDLRSSKPGFLLLVQPVRNGQQPIGLVAGILDNQVLNELLRHETGDDHTSFFLADSRGQLLSGSQPFQGGAFIGELDTLKEHSN